jgi:hypothetical protein
MCLEQLTALQQWVDELNIEIAEIFKRNEGCQRLARFQASGRHTAPAIAVAALRALRILPDALLLVLQLDHVILNEAAFARVTEAAAEVAKNDYQISAAAKPKVPRGHRLMVSTLPGYKPLLRAIRTRPPVRRRTIPVVRNPAQSLAS